MFSKACEYALRACIMIAQKSSEGHKLSIKQIVGEIQGPEHFVAKILQQLSRGGIVRSAKGPSGGFFVDDEQRQIKVIEIVKLIDGDELFKGCGLGLPNCSDEKPCPLHEKFGKIRKDITDMLQTSTLETMSGKLEDGLAFLKR
jgi:Rrf2 family protein